MMNQRLNIPTLLIALSLAAQGQGDPIVTDGADLGFQIVGTIVQKNSDDNVALVKETNGSVRAIKRNYRIGAEYRVIAIAGGWLEVKNQSGTTYRVQQDKFAAIAAKSGPGTDTGAKQGDNVYREEGFERQNGAIKMSSTYRDKLVKEDLARVLMQATVEPYMEGGQIVGFKISQIDSGSIYDKAGLLNGDIITQINEQDLSSVATSIKLLQSLKGASHVKVEVRRGDTKTTMTLDVN